MSISNTADIHAVADALKNIFGSRMLFNEPLSRHTTFRIGGPADAFVMVKDELELGRLIALLEESKTPLFVFGAGSKILAPDKGLHGIVARLEFKELAFDGQTARAGAGVMLPHLAREAARLCLSGLEYLHEIPATVGGSVVMKAAWRGYRFDRLITDVRTVRCGSTKIILGVDLKFSKDNAEDIALRMEEARKIRRQTQPQGVASAGSVFKNPEGDFAARLIDETGLKGLSIGDAEVSDKHAGFIINKGNAKAADVIGLIEIIKAKVFEKFGKELELGLVVMKEN